MNTGTSSISIAAQGWTELATPPAPNPPVELCDFEERHDCPESEVQFSAVILDLIDKLAPARDVAQAGRVLVAELQEYFGCHQIAFGMCGKPSQHCRLIALSGRAEFDPRSEFVRTVEAALNECVLREDTTVWPAQSQDTRHGTLACQKLAVVAGIGKVIGVPLRGALNNIVGVILFLGTEQFDRPRGVQAFLRICEHQVGKWIELIRRAEPGFVTRCFQSARSLLARWQGKLVLGASLAIAAGLAIPMPYKIGCDCQVQPFVRRFVVAPFDGRLEKAMVKQGDVVSENQVLAQLDGREIRWELAGLQAERSRAAKQRDSAMATKKVAEAQAAKLEMDRLDLKIQLLEHRAENLDSRSPIAGIVISGDLERAEGAPLSTGQTLFEIAPLDNMVIELAVPEDEIAYVYAGQTVSIGLDAYPGRYWDAKIVSIHPRAEVRQSQNAFIAEVHLDNPDAALRPGMNGRGKIIGTNHAIAWNVFHKLGDSVVRRMGY